MENWDKYVCVCDALKAPRLADDSIKGKVLCKAISRLERRKGRNYTMAMFIVLRIIMQMVVLIVVTFASK